MQYRSTNPDGRYTHQGGAFVAGVEYGSGIELNPTSSGADPTILPAGDEANKGITLKAKGTGTATIGDSSNTVRILGANVQIAGSTAPFAGFQRQLSTAISTPNFNSSGSMGVISTVTMAGVNSSHVIVYNALNLSTGILLTDVFPGSTVGSLNLKWNKYSTTTIAASTCRIRFLAIKF